MLVFNLLFCCCVIMNLPDSSCASQKVSSDLGISQRLETEFELRSGLDNCKKKFIGKKTGRIAFVGGSITANPGWRDLVCSYIKQKFPETRFDFINAGVGGTNSTFGAARLDDFVLNKGKIDLMFLEFAVNDTPEIGPEYNPSLAIEGIIRHTRLINPEMDILMMYFADVSKVQEIKDHKYPTIISIHERVAQYYDIAALNLAKDIASRLDANEFAWSQFSSDTCHPTKYGGECYAQTITAALHSAWQSTDLDANGQPISQVLPPPMDKCNYEKGHLIDINNARLISGWKIVANWIAEKTCNYVGGIDVLTATSPGSMLELSFEGSAIGIYAIAGMDAGTIDYEIDEEIDGTLQLFDQYCSMFHRPVFRVFANNLANGKHKLRMVIGNVRDEKSVGTVVRIVKFSTF